MKIFSAQLRVKGRRTGTTDGSRGVSTAGMYPQNRLINDHDLGLACSAHAHYRSCLEWPIIAKLVCTGLQILSDIQWMRVIAIRDEHADQRMEEF